MLIPLLVGIAIFIGFFSLCMFLLWKFEKGAIETETFWQLVNILVDYPDIVWEDIEFILGTTSPNGQLRQLVREKFFFKATADDVARELVKKYFNWRKVK